MKIEEVRVGQKLICIVPSETKIGVKQIVEEINYKYNEFLSTNGEWFNAIDFEPFNEELKEKEDVVNHPIHYTNGKIECIEAIIAAVSNLNGSQGYLVGNIIKYVWRYKDKNGAEDLNKAKWYLEKLIGEVKR